jgi:hypothetical protein
MTRIFINAGSGLGLQPSNIVSGIASLASISGKMIGAIDIYKDFSFVEVPAEKADLVVESMKAFTHHGKNVSVELAGARQAPKERSGGGNNRGSYQGRSSGSNRFNSSGSSSTGSNRGSSGSSSYRGNSSGSSSRSGPSSGSSHKPSSGSGNFSKNDSPRSGSSRSESATSGPNRNKRDNKDYGKK